MYFESLAAFWQMGGYALYVWLSFGISYVLLIGLVWYSHYQQKAFKQQLAQQLAREQRIKQYQEHAE